MSDDIVTRLRQEWEYGNNAKGCDYEMFAQAADEIEGLRSEVSRLMQVICDASPDDDYLLVRQECDAIWEKIHKDNQAVRGE